MLVLFESFEVGLKSPFPNLDRIAGNESDSPRKFARSILIPALPRNQQPDAIHGEQAWETIQVNLRLIGLRHF